MPVSSSDSAVPFDPNSEVNGLPAIAVVYARLAGRQLQGDTDRAERRDFCLAHNDQGSPSCDYNTERQVWHCHTCGEHGGVYDLIISSGKAQTRRQAVAWLREQRLLPERATQFNWETADVIYEYTNNAGILLYQVGRKNLPNGKKEFRQRRPRPDGREGFINDLKGVERVPFRLPDLLAACERGETIYVVEGEKDAERLRTLGLIATTNAQGADWVWPVTWASYFVGAKRVVCLGDNDEAGLQAAQFRASVCARTVSDTRVLAPLPGVGPKGDISNWLDMGGTLAQLDELVDSAPIAAPYEIGYPETAVHVLVNDMTDTGNAAWFISCVGEDIVWVPEQKSWYGWDGTRWIPDVMVTKLVRVALDKMLLASANYTGREREDFSDWAKSSRADTKRRALLECAKGERYIRASEMDAHRSLLNLQNGILDCEKGILLPHDRTYCMTKIASIGYAKNAECPNWLGWLDAAMQGDKECIDYIQQIMGGMLVGRPGTRRLFFAYGPPGTGKSTITNVMHALLGDYACSVDFSVFAHSQAKNSSAASPELARLKGMRLITAVESRDNDKLDAARLKQFVGGDMITARNLHQGVIEFPIEGTLFMSGNSRPIIDADESLWSKIKMIPFEYQFPNQDLNYFRNKLQPELNGILAWAVDGIRALARNEWHLQEPGVVRTATAEYREDENRLSPFVSEYCDLYTDNRSEELAKFRIQPKDLRSAYQAWCEKEHIRMPLGDRAFANALRRIAGIEGTKSHNVRYWRGIRLKQDYVNRLFQPDQRPTNRRTQEYEETDF